MAGCAVSGGGREVGTAATGAEAIGREKLFVGAAEGGAL